MDLFPSEAKENLLPQDGFAIYFGPIFDVAREEFYFDRLMDKIPWQSDELVMFGKRIVTSRKVAWFGDEAFPYKYSGTEKVALPWMEVLLDLKEQAEKLSGERFNSCLLNLYHDGREGMGWHSDDESSIVRNSAIASLSFGVARKFAFKHRETKETVSLMLERGSLLVMKGETQRFWVHALPKTKKVDTARINLTFRQMRDESRGS